MRDILKTISKKERKLVLLLSVLVIFITCLPYVFGYLRTPEGSFYTGIHALTPGDTNVYYSYLEQVDQGDIVFKDLYTSEPQDASLVKPFWSAVGIFGKLLYLPHWLTIQITRSILAFVFVVVAYLFISYIFSKRQHRTIAIILLLFSSGLGGLLSPFLEYLKYIGEGYYHWPMDLWVPESITFLSLLHIPHILFSSILSLIVFLSLLISFESDKYKYSIVAGITAFAWFSFHPFHFFTLLVVIVAYLFINGIINRKIPFSYIKHSLVTIILALPAVLYHFVIIAQDSLMAGRAEQNILYTPAWWLLIVSYGFVGILAIIGVAKVFKKKDNKWFFVATWLAVQTLLLYAPLAFQRRLSQNLHFPMVLLAVLAVLYIANKYKHTKIIRYFINNKLILIFLFVIFMAFSNIYALVNDFLLYKNMTYPFFYLSDDYKESFNWIKENVEKNEIVLSEWIDGNFIPGYSGRTVYLGHGVETLNYKSKQEQTSWFFQNNSDVEAKQEFLKQHNIDYIFFSDRSRELGDFDPVNKKFLQQEFSSDHVSIYRLIE